MEHSFSDRTSDGRCEPEFAEQFQALYDEIRRVARGALRGGFRGWRRDATLQTTALVHESYLRLVDGDAAKEQRWSDPGHFLSLTARAMRFVLVDYARARTRQKRGGDAERIPFDESLAMSEDRAHEVLALEDALAKLADRNERLCRVVECRYIAGMTLDETAEALDVSTMTVKRDWSVARAFLARELGTPPETAPP